MAALGDGGVLIAEEGTGADDTSAGVSLLSGGTLTRVVSGLPSSRDSGDLSGAPLVGLSPDGTTAYVGHFGAGSLLTFPVPTAKAAATSTALGPDDLVPAMLPLNRVDLVNPFDIAFAPDGSPVVTDASENGVAMEDADGTTVFIHRFDTLAAPDNETLRIDAVPTGIAAVGDEYYVTLTGGCPYPESSGRLVAIDGQRNERIVVDGLDMPIDVAVDDAGTVWVLEFARFEEGASCFTGEGYLPGTGRLSRLVGDRLETVVDGLDYPGAVLPLPGGSLLVTEVFAGRVLEISFATESDAIAPEEAWGFTEVAQEVGLGFRHGAFRDGLSMDPVAAMGAGLCWIDYDRDGWLDLYLVNSHSLDEAGTWEAEGGLPHNALFRNDEGVFADVSSGSGADLAMRGNGCTAADFDGDGWTDIYVTADGPNALLHNNGDGTFTDIAVEMALLAPEWSTAAVAADLNADGRLDLFVGSYIDLENTVDQPVGAFPQDYFGVADHLFISSPDGAYEDAAVAAGLDRADRALGAIFSDLDGDGDLDLYVANDGQPNRLYERMGEGPVRFVDVTSDAGVGDPGSGMGVAAGDYDGDGATDLFVTNWQRELHALYRNEDPAGLGFLNTTQRIGLAGLGNNATGWGTSWSDVDNDGDLDLLTVNGMVPITDIADDRQSARVFGNLSAEGSPGQFRDWTSQLGLGDTPLLARGSAAADFDNDGDIDVAVATIGGGPALLRNDGAPGRWLQVIVDPPLPGTVVSVEFDDGTVLTSELKAGSSYLASEDPRSHFGLGDRTTVAKVTVAWPTGQSTTDVDVDADTVLRLSPS